MLETIEAVFLSIRSTTTDGRRGRDSKHRKPPFTLCDELQRPLHVFPLGSPPRRVFLVLRLEREVDRSIGKRSRRH